MSGKFSNIFKCAAIICFIVLTAVNCGGGGGGGLQVTSFKIPSQLDEYSSGECSVDVTGGMALSYHWSVEPTGAGIFTSPESALTDFKAAGTEADREIIVRVDVLDNETMQSITCDDSIKLVDELKTSPDLKETDFMGMKLVKVEGNVYTFEYSGTPPEIRVGDLITGIDGEGFIKRVLDVQDTGSHLIITVSDASLDEAIQEGKITVTIDYSAGREGESVRYVQNSDGIELFQTKPAILLDLTEEELVSGLSEGVLFENDSLRLSFTDDEIDGNSRIEFTPTIRIVYYASLLEPNYLTVSADDGDLDIILKLLAEVQGEYSMSVKQKIPLPPAFGIDIDLGIFKITGGLTLTAGCDLNLHGEGWVTSGFYFKQHDIDTGVKIVDQFPFPPSFEPIFSLGSLDSGFYPITADLRADATIKAYLKPELGLNIADSLKLNVDLVPYFKLVGEGYYTTPPPDWCLSCNLYAGCTSDFSYKGSIFGIFELNDKISLYSEEFPLCDEQPCWKVGPCGELICDPPSKPTNVSATDGNYEDYVKITWNPVSGADYYRIYRNGTQIKDNQPSSPYNDTTAIPDVHYDYEVSAVDSCGEGLKGGPDKGWRPPICDPPGKPTNVSASDGYYEDYVEITWNPVSGADYYRIYRDNFLIKDNQQSSPYNDTTATQGVHYNYEVSAVNNCGEGLKGGPDEGWRRGHETDPPVWDTTIGITNAIPGYDKVTVTWGSATDAQTPPVSYAIYMDTDNYPFDQAPVAYDTAHNGFKTIPDLDNGIYWFGVRCRDSVDPPNYDTNTVVIEASVPPISTAKTWGGTSTDRGYGIAVDDSGNKYVTGYFSQTVDFDPGSGVTERTASGIKKDAFISKFTSSSEFEWVSTWGDSDHEWGQDVAIDNSGNVYVVGADDYDMFLKKFSSNGNLLWSNDWGSSEDDECKDVIVDNSGNVYVTGYFSQTVDFDPGTGTEYRTADVGYDVFLIKFNSSGTFQWVQTWGGTSYEEGMGIDIDNSGNIYVSGRFLETCDFDPGPGINNHTSNGGNDAFVSKFSSGGSFQWAKTWGGTGWDYAEDVAIDGSGKVYITGFFENTVDFDPNVGVDNHTFHGERDAYLSKLDTDGNFEWALTWGDGQTYAYGVAAYDSNIYVTGFYSGSVDFNPGSGSDIHVSDSGTTDIFISKFQSNGVFGWAKTLSGSHEEAAFDVIADSSKVYATGYFTGIVDFDPGPGEYWGTAVDGDDVFLVEFDE
jgi:hypothetical protein